MFEFSDAVFNFCKALLENLVKIADLLYFFTKNDGFDSPRMTLNHEKTCQTIDEKKRLNIDEKSTLEP